MLKIFDVTVCYIPKGYLNNLSNDRHSNWTDLLFKVTFNSSIFAVGFSLCIYLRVNVLLTFDTKQYQNVCNSEHACTSHCMYFTCMYLWTCMYFTLFKVLLNASIFGLIFSTMFTIFWVQTVIYLIQLINWLTILR